MDGEWRCRVVWKCKGSFHRVQEHKDVADATKLLARLRAELESRLEYSRVEKRMVSKWEPVE